MSEELKNEEVINNENITNNEVQIESKEEVKQNQKVSEEQNSDESPTPQQLRFKTLRELKDKAERERDELSRKLKEFESKSAPQVADDEDDDNDDPLHKEVKTLRKEIREMSNHNKLLAVKAELKQRFPDFFDVVTKENTEIFSAQYPELAATLANNPDPYSAGISAYKLFKQFNVYMSDQELLENKKITNNSLKPKPTNSIKPHESNSPLANAALYQNRMTEEEKKNRYREMLQYAKK